MGKNVTMAKVLSVRRYTYDEWVSSPLNTPRMELVEGIPVERMTRSGDHAVVVEALGEWLMRAKQAGYGRCFRGPAGVLLDPAGARRNVREPDLFFFRRDHPHYRFSKGFEGVPDLAIEVLSPDNRTDDLPGGSVWKSCERFGVPAYWIVDYEARTVIQYEHRSGHFHELGTLRPGGVLQSPLFPDVTLPVADVFAELDE